MPHFLSKLATITSLRELSGFEAQLQSDNRMTPERIAAIARRKAELMKGK
jgi:hypothetical protein